MKTTRLVPLSIASLLACAACATAQNRTQPREYGSVTPVQPSATTNVPLPQSVLDALRADASKRAGLATEQVTVASAEKVTWTDGALGCPQPGRMYTQSLVPGYRVFIRAGDRTLLYHTSETDQVVHCPTVSLRPVKPDAPVAQ
jgi:hypothetical protein